MGSQSLLQLPTIDFSNIHKNDQGTIVWDCKKTQVFKALQEYGCFETSLTTQISPDLLQSVFASLKQLFDLPLETKLRNLDPRPIHGYLGPSKDVPLYESLGMEDIESFTNLMWPQGNHEFCKTIQEYVKKLKEMNEIVRMMVLESLNLDKYMVEHMELTKHLIRVMKYRVPEENESDLGIKTHADRNLMTIIQQNEAGGLEIQTKEGEWIKLKNSSNCIIVMAGESFHVWTNGRLHAPVHKVLMTNDLTRYSIGLFLVPKFGKIVKAPEEMVDDEYPLLYKPFNYEDFLRGCLG